MCRTVPTYVSMVGTDVSSCINPVSAALSLSLFFLPGRRVPNGSRPVAGNADGIARAVDVRMIYRRYTLRPVFVFSIRLIRTVTGNTAR